MGGRDPSKVVIFDLDNAKARLKGMGEKVFVNSMSDTFHEAIPVEVIRSWFQLFAEDTGRQFQILTKRINRAYALVKSGELRIPPNVWLGTSIEDPAHLFRADTLRKIPAKIRFISFEPLLKEIPPPINLEGISWVIVGGESDYKDPRPMSPYWAFLIRKEAERQKVAFFFKQHGGIGGDGAGGDQLLGQAIKEFPKY
jgi:protein gp37